MVEWLNFLNARRAQWTSRTNIPQSHCLPRFGISAPPLLRERSPCSIILAVMPVIVHYSLGVRAQAVSTRLISLSWRSMVCRAHKCPCRSYCEFEHFSVMSNSSPHSYRFFSDGVPFTFLFFSLLNFIIGLLCILCLFCIADSYFLVAMIPKLRQQHVQCHDFIVNLLSDLDISFLRLHTHAAPTPQCSKGVMFEHTNFVRTGKESKTIL